MEPTSTIAAVDALLTDEVNRLAAEWRATVGPMGLDVLPDDLPAWLGSLLIGGGKRLRIQMAHWGFVAAGRRVDDSGYADLVRAAAALELLHLFALVHDDVMDESASRRGHASAHVQAAGWHGHSHALGDRDVFGRNLAILLGDLAHTMADRLADDLPPAMRQAWYALCIELIVGQRGDLTGAAARRRDFAHADRVARLKSGRYSIQRPLELGAMAAGAAPDVIDGLLDSGEHIGRAFALRDDLLGIWGDPNLTGKPAGDDLFEAKATVLMSLARDRLTGHAAELLATVGTPGFRRSDVAPLAEAMQDAGVEAEAERLIAKEYAAAVALLKSGPFDPRGAEGIALAAHSIAWRNA